MNTVKKVFPSYSEDALCKMWWGRPVVEMTVELIKNRFDILHKALTIIPQLFEQATPSEISSFKEGGRNFGGSALFEKIKNIDERFSLIDDGDQWCIHLGSVLNACIRIGPTRKTMMDIGLSSDAFGILQEDNEDLREADRYIDDLDWGLEALAFDFTGKPISPKSGEDAMFCGDYMNSSVLHGVFKNHSMNMSDLGVFEVLKHEGLHSDSDVYNILHLNMFIACLKVAYERHSGQELIFANDVDGIDLADIDSSTQYIKELLGVHPQFVRSCLDGRRERGQR